MNESVVVIGAGLSGLVALKELLATGMDVKCFEKGNDIGGVFSEIGTYDSVELTVSNYFMAYSDFMPYDEEIRFWKRSEYKDYLDAYAEKFNLRKHIQFNAALENVEQLESGRWQLSITDTNSGATEGTTEKVVADRVAICSGQFQEANIPKIAGLETFSGPVIHSSQYTNVANLEQFHDKKVLCFGMGESAADIIAEIASIAKRTILSLRRHHMFSCRYVSREKKPFGYTTIDVLQSRFYHSLPAKFKSRRVRRVAKDSCAGHCPTPSRKLMSDHILAAGDEPGSVVTKTERIFNAQAEYDFVIDVSGVKSIENNTVEFNSGTRETFDAVMFCTGFKFHLPYLPEAYQFSDIRECYLQMFHPKIDSSLAFVGFARPQQGGVPLMSELQSRYLAMIWSGKVSLPKDIKSLAEADAQRWQTEFYETPKVFGLVNGLRFNERLAALIGCRPPCPNFFTHPKQYFCYWFSHVWPSQYRLVGPDSCNDAKARWDQAPSATSPKENLKSFLLMHYFRLRALFPASLKNKWRPIVSKD